MKALMAALYTKLSAGTALLAELGAGTPIFHDIVPPDAALPAVVYSYIAGGDDNTTPRRTKGVVVSVKGVAETLGEAADVDVQLDALLHDQAGSVTGWTNYWLMRETDFSYAEQSAGEIFWHVGGHYRIRLSK